MGHAVVDGYMYIDAVLRRDTELMSYLPGGLHTDVVDDLNTATPYGIIQFQAGIDLNTANAVYIWTNALFQAKAVGPASVAQKLGQAAERMQELLKPRVVIAGFTVSAWREQVLYYPEDINGTPWRHIGGIYRLIIEPSS
jgi:hypothetical protein